MVQLFRKTQDDFELVQTLDDHVGAVGRLLFMNDGERLLSCSADRTVIVRDR
jgi:WD domain, G-beta repeat.